MISNNPADSTLTQASWDTASSGTVGPHDTTAPAVRQAVAETFSQTRDILDTSPPPARTITSLPVSVRPTLGKRPRTIDSSSSEEDEEYTHTYARRTQAAPDKRARTNQPRHVYNSATKSFTLV